MDADYGRNLDHDGAPTKAFEPSLFVWATAMNRPAEDRAIVDAGLKALAFDSGPPIPPRPASAPPRNTAESPTQPPTTCSVSAAKVASSPATAHRPVTSTAGTSACR